ncbi:MAG: Glutaredoxin-like protein, YruB-family [Candidatus Wolfebacteria bacterium GW2011_GWC1_43_10]|uniref:Glutaredoxin-like protein, YruB-family n=2 Tax=Candidatus Wolfeibacteriota TaxID=1752735 RepID=A0A0G1F5L4_9BACT|nr:MAG: Glutaredoxin-like protein, YruB-family [Candidatus Wolfebacteria bacterium GW2011_GWC1_43_10]KKT22336.1 MAG: Glutaredoxin-like protein, YruB-family [Parcubacteria group bacterium GW2011_GWB1_43_8b]OGM89313.1 MAG: NrdH-redoxin [Candidatus Wolfebacteria bacterium GWA1_42_9]
MIKIYSTTHCPYCKMAKDYFTKNSVAFEEYNVENDEKALEEMVKKSGQMGVPVIDIDGVIVVGFDRHAIEHALGNSS